MHRQAVATVQQLARLLTGQRGGTERDVGAEDHPFQMGEGITELWRIEPAGDGWKSWAFRTQRIGRHTGAASASVVNGWCYPMGEKWRCGSAWRPPLQN